MAAATLASTNSGQGIFTIVKFTDVTDGLTYAGPTPKAYWAQVTTDPTTNTSAGINVTWDATDGYTFYPGIDTVGVTLFIVS